MENPYQLVKDTFWGEPIEHSTMTKIKTLLEEKYPDIEWTVDSRGNMITLDAKFSSPEEETFYLLAWS